MTSCTNGRALPVVASPVTSAVTSTIRLNDIAGTWAGRVDYGDTVRGQSKPSRHGKGDGYLALWPTSRLFWFEHHMPDWGWHSGGRWRLVGDTLWLGSDWLYGDGDGKGHGAAIDDSVAYKFLVIKRAGEDAFDLIPGVADTVDSLHIVGYPKNDSLFWSRDPRVLAKRNFLHYVTAYKISLTGDQLTLVRLDSVSDSLGLDNMVKTAVYRRVKSPIRIVRSWPSLPSD